MTTVGDILAYLETIAPPELKMDWDNVGLLCGSKNRRVNKILVALDPFEHVCKEAAAWGAELIVTHHPLIFSAPREVTDETSVGRCIQLLCAHFAALNLLQIRQSEVIDIICARSTIRKSVSPCAELEI